MGSINFIFKIVLCVSSLFSIQSQSIGDKCREWAKSYDVIPYETFGRLPQNIIEQWEANSCNAYIKQFANKNTGLEIEKASVIVDRALKNPEPLTEDQLKRHHSQLNKFFSYIESGICKHIYLDMGTNVGVQLRKLYQPDSFPGAHVLPLFKEHFGDTSNRKSVCALGFEPNSKHNARLDLVQNAYQKAGFPMVILTETAVSIANGKMTFYNGGNGEDLGASLVNWSGRSTKSTVISLDIDHLIKKMMNHWNTTDSSKVVAKMDIEGAEFNVIPHMLSKGSLCMIDYMMIEWHFRFINARKVSSIFQSQDIFEDVINSLTERSSDCKFKLIELDDESYSGGKDNSIAFPSS